MPQRGRGEQQPRRAHGVGREDHDLRALRRVPPSGPTYTTPVARPRESVAIRITCARVTSRTPRATAPGQCVRSGEDFARSGQPNMHDPRSRTPGADRTAAWRSRWIRATNASPVRCVPGRDGRPTRAAAPAASDTRSREGGIAVETGDAELPLDPPVVGHEFLIVHRPVIRDPLGRAQLEVGRHVAMPLSGENQHRAADAVPHQRRDLGVPLVDRLVPDTLSMVRPPEPL